jgi:predicted branched-subunit amino acid permease
MGYLICERCAGYYQLEEGESPEDFERCRCGGYLNYVEDVEEESFQDKINVRRIVGVVVGALIMLSSYYIFSADPYSSNFVLYNNITAFLIWVAAGLIGALIAGGNIRSGISNGFYAATISGLLVILYFYYLKTNYFTNPVLAENIAFFAALCVVYLLIPSVFSMAGGFVGIFSRKMIFSFSRVA